MNEQNYDFGLGHNTHTHRRETIFSSSSHKLAMGMNSFCCYCQFICESSTNTDELNVFVLFFFFLYDISAINQPALDCCTIVAHKFTPPSDIVSTKQLIKVTPTTIDFHFVWSSYIYKNGHHFFLYIYSFMHWHIALRRRIWNNNVKWTTAAATVKYKWQQIPSSTYLINSIKFRFRTIENFCINSK